MKTKPTSETIDELARAREALTALRERVGAGDGAVTAAQIAQAEDDVHLAELRIEASAELAAREAEKRRLARIEEVRQSLAAGFLRDQAATVVRAYEQAVDACAALYAAKVAYENELAGVLGELHRLRPLPPGMNISGSGRDRRATVEGRSWSPSPRYNVALVAEAAASGIDRAGAGRQGDSDGRGDLARVAGSASRIERIRRYAGADEQDVQPPPVGGDD